MEFEAFELTARKDAPGKVVDKKCISESLEIRDLEPFDGLFYCGQDWTPGSVLTSQSNTLIVILHSEEPLDSQKRGRLRARINFIPDHDKVSPSIGLWDLPNRLLKLPVDALSVFIKGFNEGIRGWKVTSALPDIDTSSFHCPRRFSSVRPWW